MRLLIVNPNTSQGVTARIAAAARAVAEPTDSFTVVSALSGPRLIVTQEDGVLATAGVLAAIKHHKAPIDGVILASFGDTGAAEVRAAYPHLRLVGIAEAAFAETRRFAGMFSVVTFAPEVASPLLDMAKRHGVADRLMRVASISDPLTCDPADVADLLFEPLLKLSLDCAHEGAQAIVLGGGPLAGLAARIAPRCPVPVIDGTQAAILHLRREIQMSGSVPG
jgi:allantoin racemase